MGNRACCGYEGESGTDLEVRREATDTTRKRKGLSVTNEQVEQWLKRYEAGDSMEVLFPDGHRIECNLKIDRERNFMNLSFNQKARPIQLDDIVGCLYGTDPVLDSECVDSKLLKDPRVVGFRLGSSGRAIAFSFRTVTDAQCFVVFVENEIERHQKRTRP